MFSSHFSRAAITDPHQNQCEDDSTLHHPELRPSPETGRPKPLSRLFENRTRWYPSEAPEHPKQRTSDKVFPGSIPRFNPQRAIL